ncbi:MAG: hypothetical protein ACI4PW_00805 [Alphaproteobacteria bacterium]
MEGTSVKNMWGSGRRILEMWNAGRKLWEQKILSGSAFFTSSGVFTIPQTAIFMKLTIAGAGGGCAGDTWAVYVWGGGGGGGGGRIERSFYAQELQPMCGRSFAVIVGAPGNNGSKDVAGSNGGYSQFQMAEGSPTAYGGYGGGLGCPGGGGGGGSGANYDTLACGGGGGSGGVGATGAGGSGHTVNGQYFAYGGGSGTGHPGTGSVFIEYAYFE